MIATLFAAVFTLGVAGADSAATEAEPTVERAEAQPSATGAPTSTSPESAEGLAQTDAPEPDSAPEPETGGHPVEPDALVVLVLPLKAQRVNEELVATIGEVLATELAERSDYNVVTLSDLEALLEAERLKDLLGCDDISCAVEIGGAAGADRILTGSIGRLDQSFTVTLRWLDAVYSEPLGRASEQSEPSELALRAATQKALHTLLGLSAEADAQTRRQKRAPTFWTAEISAGLGFYDGPEIYDLGPTGALRLAWGGKTSTSNTYYYLLGGLSLARFSGKSTGPTGTIEFSRTFWIPNLDLRAAIPVTASKRTRLLVEGGLGLAFDVHRADQEDGIRVSGTHAIFAGLLGAGLWHRWSHDHSLFVMYRLVTLFAGEGADGVSRLVEVDSTLSTLFINAVEVGWALHF